ncbi:ATP-binding protein [Marinobacterium jannaschii]|uniref:ATP-binding protein n=1 Tax=Marinobacterium jannaschii TaxID=64970 RepID=UPI000483378C|nr:ATP-binding protein [Marinobacterium jannaschii]
MARLFITFYVAIVGSLLGYVFTINALAQHMLYDFAVEDTRSTIRGYLEVLDRLHPYEGDQATLQAARRVAEANDQILERISPQQLDPAIRRALEQGQIMFQETDDGDDDIAYFRIESLNDIFSVRLNPDSRLGQAEELVSKISVIGVLTTLGLVLALMVFMLHRKLKHLERAALAFAEGDFSARAPENRSLRVAGLNHAFNCMAEQIESLIASHKRLTNAVAHELRTPIFRLRCQLELLDYDLSVQEHQKYSEGMEEDLTELDELVDELLSYARMQRNDIQLEMQAVLLDQWLLEQQSRLERSCHHCLTVTPARRPMPASIDGRLLLRALSNLIRNADNHAVSRIAIRLEELPPCFCLHVDDDGPGIPPADRERVFEPFERLDSARTRATGGHGLGLSIVREIMQQHGGHVEVSVSPLGGARVSLCLPAG